VSAWVDRGPVLKLFLNEYDQVSTYWFAVLDFF
jgi:hypothetical protein